MRKLSHHMPLEQRPSSFKRDERGLSTMEWILLVAAVAGLATIGTLVVRGAVTGSEERTASNAVLSGDDGQLLTLQNRVNQIFSNMPPPGRTPNPNPPPDWIMVHATASQKRGMGLLCENPRDFVYDDSWGLPDSFRTDVIGDANERSDNSANVLYEMIQVHADWGATYSFHFIEPWQLGSEGQDVLRLNQDFWCRVKNLSTGHCGAVLQEEPKDNPVKADFVDEKFSLHCKSLI